MDEVTSTTEPDDDRNIVESVLKRKLKRKIDKLRCVSCKKAHYDLQTICPPCLGQTLINQQEEKKFSLCEKYNQTKRCMYNCPSCKQSSHFERLQEGHHGPIIGGCLTCGKGYGPGIACVHCGLKIGEK